MSAEELDRRIAAARAKLGERVVILGHHYQRDEIIKYADTRGDSFKLAQFAQQRPEADYILFCGVHFMAESADILSAPHQTVILPNPAAGCSMADMANIAEVEECWDALMDLYRDEVSDEKGALQPVIPVTYMNSAANLKAFCGKHGGIVCTSSNAEQVLRWAFARGRRVLFFPDEHLGRNTALKMGIPESEIVGLEPATRLRRRQGRPDTGGRESDPLERLVLDASAFRSGADRRGARGLSRRARRRPSRVPARGRGGGGPGNGSTEYIVKVIEESPAGTIWASRYRGQPREAAGQRASRQDDLLPRSGRLPLLDDVPYPPGVPSLGTRKPGRGQGHQSGDGGRGDGALGQDRPGAHAGE